MTRQEKLDRFESQPVGFRVRTEEIYEVTVEELEEYLGKAGENI